MPSKEPSRTKLRNAKIAAESAALPKIPKEVLDQIVADGPLTAQQVNATMMALKKAIIERALGGELSHHLGYPPGSDKRGDAANHRNGSSAESADQVPPPAPAPTDDPTFGMWGDREDMADVAAYIRRIRAPRFTRDGSRRKT